MGDQYYNNSIYSVTKPGKSPNYEESIYSGTGQRRTRSVYSGRTAASAYSHVTKKSTDFYQTDTASYDKKVHIVDEVLQYVWNSEEGTVFGRTGADWLRVLAYYLVLYLIIIAVWASSFALFDFLVLDEDKPVRTGKFSALQHNPSLSYYPQPDHYSTLIRYRSSRLSSVRKYVDDLVAVTQWYEDHGLQNVVAAEENVKDCSADSRNDNPETEICRFDLNVGRRCNAYKNFGFVDGEPCIALKLNRVYGWVPDPIVDASQNASGVMVKCKGRTQIDEDAIGDICYHYTTNGWNGDEDYCKRGYGLFEHYYFPYLRQIRYMSPLVFVEFKAVARNVVVMVECEAFAKNIEVDRVYRIGLVQFEMLID